MREAVPARVVSRVTQPEVRPRSMIAAPCAARSGTISAAAPCGSARKIASASERRVDMEAGPVEVDVGPADRLACATAPTRPSICTFGWRERSRTSSAPTYPVAPTIATRMRGPSGDAEPSWPPRGSGPGRRPGTAATTDPAIALTGARAAQRAAPPGSSLWPEMFRPSVVCMTRMTIHGECIVMQARRLARQRPFPAETAHPTR